MFQSFALKLYCIITFFELFVKWPKISFFYDCHLSYVQGVSKNDLEKRTQLEKYKRSMLKNFNMFVSPVRLCVRNIPPTVDDKKLVAIVKKFSENPTGLFLSVLMDFITFR